MLFGMCARHPLIKAGSGMKCRTCLESDAARTCKIHTDRKMIRMDLCQECLDAMEAAKLKEKELIRQRGEKRITIEAEKPASAPAGKVTVIASGMTVDTSANNGQVLETERKADRSIHFHNWVDWPEDEAAGEYNRIKASGDRNAMDQWCLNRPCWECEVPKREHGWVKQGKDGLMVGLSEEDSHPCPVLVLLRGASMKEVEGKALALLQDRGVNNMHDLLRIDYLPRAKRTEREMMRNRGLSDPVTDPKPWALWMPVDNRSVRIDQCLGAWERERPIVTTVAGQSKLATEKVPGNPTGRNNPAKWDPMTNTVGAEIIDLRVYREVYQHQKDQIAASLATMAGWIQALRNAVETRQGQSFYRNGESDSAFWDVREVALGMNQDHAYRPGRILVHHNAVDTDRDVEIYSEISE